MRLSDVLERFTLVSGLEPEEVSKWTVLCVDAMNEISDCILPSKGKSEKEALRLSKAAGVYAYYKYCLYTYSSKIKTFSAGVISVTTSQDEMAHARNMWEAEKAACADLISDKGDFCFRGVAV